MSESGFTEERRTVWSEGSRLAAVIRKPEGGESPKAAVLMCHGWGGVKDHLLDIYVPQYVEAGFVVMAFDYRGWGESDGKMIATAATPPLLEATEVTVPVRVIREVVDPIDQLTDIRNCLSYLVTEDGVDPERVGLFGTSYGGGHVVSMAGSDDRVKAIVAQIGGYGHPDTDEYKQLARQRMAEKARGTMDPPIPQGVDSYPSLKGTPDIARQFGHSPFAYAERITVPSLFLDAEFEEYGSADSQGGAAYEIVKKNATAERHTFPCTHYQVYNEYREPARELAIAWFQKYL